MKSRLRRSVRSCAGWRCDAAFPPSSRFRESRLALCGARGLDRARVVGCCVGRLRKKDAVPGSVCTTLCGHVLGLRRSPAPVPVSMGAPRCPVSTAALSWAALLELAAALCVMPDAGGLGRSAYTEDTRRVSDMARVFAALISLRLLLCKTCSVHSSSI